MTKRSSLRASDADRDRVAERLHQAAVEGRLLAHELEERIARALRARTYGELDAIVEDLPAGSGPMVARRPSHLELLRRYPVAAAVLLCLLGATVAGLVAAAVLVVASGLWILPIVLFFIVRGKDSRRPAHASGHSRREFGPGRVHGHRSGQF